MVYKTCIKLKTEYTNLTKNRGDELRCTGRVAVPALLNITI
jgi:hypothetical protein